MRRMPRCGTLALAIITLFASPGFAQVVPVPSPANSTVPSCISVCPAGDRPAFTVIVRDFSGLTLSNSAVYLDACGCANSHFCPLMPGDDYYVPGPMCQPAKITNALGRASFTPRLGGACSGPFRVLADGVILKNPVLASIDQNGDLMVTAADVAIHAAKIGTSDLTGDFDCNGVVDQLDEEMLQEHMGHTCDASTGIRGIPWGALKVIYR